MDPVAVRSAVAAVGVVVSLLVVYQAYRGYLRNGSRAMRALAVGIALLGTVHFLLLLPGGTSSELDLGLSIVRQLVDIAGLAVVFYALTRA
ncbi:DUF7521 family protein [Haloarchaeobius iranensis]|uniref:Uncharacterized protein n=1 Tax=Haloarchaeobius iranensis TaxID=996166 RepID=A0A1H0ARQ6_9EURY|nr:hypothetical protein [Haloarchaeobius iranensis]SDN36014.1 hypothetical protein SAMN05192554_12914 [Haloarchaeobius iranensis]